MSAWHAHLTRTVVLSTVLLLLCLEAFQQKKHNFPVKHYLHIETVVIVGGASLQSSYVLESQGALKPRTRMSFLLSYYFLVCSRR